MVGFLLDFHFCRIADAQRFVQDVDRTAKASWSFLLKLVVMIFDLLTNQYGLIIHKKS